MPDAAIIEPTERSKPPAIITIVAPKDAIPTIVTARPILAKLLAVRKYGDKREKSIICVINTTKRPKPVEPKFLFSILIRVLGGVKIG